MSLHYDWAGAIPEETVRVARAAFAQGSVAMQMRDLFGAFVSDRDLDRAYLIRGRPVETPWRLALVTVLQFREGLSDRQAAEAVRGRIDWKYALGLELSDAGFDYSVLSEFRDRLVADEMGRGCEGLFLTRLLEQARARGWLKARGRQRTDSTHVLAAIRTLNRLMLVAETVRAALNSLAVAAPEWLHGHVRADWHDRYDQRVEEYRLPTAKTARAALATTIGADGLLLLQAVYAPSAPPWLREIPAVQALRAVWVQQYYAPDQAGAVRWRDDGDWPPSAMLIQSPYDTDARYSTKRDTHWTGYKVHLTETCDPDTPHLITHVETTPATTADSTMLGRIHQELAGKELLPAAHLVDAGYIDAEHLVASRQRFDVDVVGPVPLNQNWQARAGQGFDVACFAIDWEARAATCPAGCTSVKWVETHDRHGQGIINIEFRQADCRVCAHRPRCTRATTEPRGITVRPQAAHMALQAARQRQTTTAFKEQYAARAGIEGTISQGTRAFGFRRTRYAGLVKTHLQHVLTAVAINVTRMVAWVDETPFNGTRHSSFARLPAAA
jgi:transposase